MLSEIIYDIQKHDARLHKERARQFGFSSEPDIILPRQILIIEDDAEFAEATAHAIEEKSFSEVNIAHDPFEAEQMMSEKAYDLVLVDWNLPILNGFNTLRRINKNLDMDVLTPESWFERKTPVIVVTVCDKSVVESEKKPKGCFRYVGVVSKGQPLEGILQELSNIYSENIGGALLSLKTDTVNTPTLPI